MSTPPRVISTYYALTGLFNLSTAIIMGVNTLFILDAGLSIFQAFAANAAFTAGQVIFEIPTGLVADTRGRRISFLLSAATLMVGTSSYIYLAATGAPFLWWAIASVILGLGFTFYTGAVEAWFVDALAAAGGPEDLDPYFARSAQLFGAALLIGSIGGGVLGSFDLSYPYYMRVVLLVLLFVVGAVFMKDDGFDSRKFRLREVPKEIAAVGSASWKHGWMDRRVRLLMMLSFLHMGFLIWGWYAWQPYFLELLGQNLIWVAGVIAAAVSVTMMVGNQVVRMLHGKVSRNTIMIIGSTGLPICMIGVGLVPSFYPAVAIFLVGMLFFGIVGPAKQAAMHRIIPKGQRATIISFDGLLGSAGGIGSQLGLAKIAQDRGYAMGYLVGGAAMMLGIPIAMLFRKRMGDGNPPQEPASSPEAA